MTNPDRTAAAPVDALLLAQARWRDDQEAATVVSKYSDPWATSQQLADWLRAAVQKALECGAGPEFGDRDEFDVIARWIQGEPANHFRDATKETHPEVTP